jgi:thioredoxin-related protein
MDFFVVLQMMFDAVLLFGVLFLFHFSVHQTQKKKEEWDILKNAQVLEIKENLQELLMTLKQLGKEVSDNIQEQVREAEEKTEIFKKVIVKLQRDLQKTVKLAEEVSSERVHLEEKFKAIETAKKTFIPKTPQTPKPMQGHAKDEKLEVTNVSKRMGFERAEGGLGFASGVVREVYRLSDEKIEMGEIVQRTQLSRAEIQLILNLRGNGFTTPN